MKFLVLWLSFVNVWLGLGQVIYLVGDLVFCCELPASGQIGKYKYKYLDHKDLNSREYSNTGFANSLVAWFYSWQKVKAKIV